MLKKKQNRSLTSPWINPGASREHSVNWVRKCVGMALILGAALTLLLYTLTPGPDAHLEIDSGGYERTATYFAATSDLVDPATPTCHPVQTLAYPFFVGMIYKLFGHAYGWVVGIQFLLSIICGLLLYSIATHLWGAATGCIAVFLWSINLGFLVYVQFLMTEMLLVTFLIAFIHRIVMLMSTKQWYDAALAGFFLGCSVVVKPAGLLFIAPLTVFLFIAGAGSYMRRLGFVALAALSFMLPIGGYMLRNKMRFGRFAIAPMSNEILYRYFSAKVKGVIEGKNHEELLNNEQWCTSEDLLDEQGWQHSKEYLLHAVRTRPDVIISLWITNVLKTWLGLFTTQFKVLLDPAVRGGECSFFKMNGTTFMVKLYRYITCGQLKWLHVLALIEVIWTLFRYICVLMALLRLFIVRNYFLFSFCVLYLAYFTGVTGHDGCCRYRMMVEPILLILTAYGIHTFVHLYAGLSKR